MFRSNQQHKFTRGDLVQVCTEAQIQRTFDRLGRNRGLGFGPEMVRFCGRRLRVARRVERLIVEWTGQLRTLSDTVALEGALCDGLAFRACPRACYLLWREIWLCRVEDQNHPDQRKTKADRGSKQNQPGSKQNQPSNEQHAEQEVEVLGVS